ncbi:MAG: HAMP domain-containing protein [Anaerolineae bacterium]
MTSLKAFFNRLARRLWAVAGAASVRIKILGIVLSLMVLLSLGVTFQVQALLEQTLRKRLQEQSLSVAQDLAARSTDLILINDIYGLHRLLQDTLANNSDVRYAFVVSADGQVAAHTFGEGFPRGLLEANQCEGDCVHHHTVGLNTTEGYIWDTAVPIFEGQAGVARVGLSEQNIQRAITTITAQLLLTFILVGVLGIVAASFLTWILTRPIQALVSATRAVGQGDLTQRVPRWANDEIGELADAFNAMTEQLALAEQARTERDRLRAQLLEQVITAQEEERKRIARELHDETGQAITMLMVGLRSLMEQCPLPAVLSHAESLREVAAETLEGVRNLALELRPSILDDMGLAAALERHVAEYRSRYQLEVDLVIRGLGDHRLPVALETALYRIIQESLTNVVRHASASTVSVLLEKRETSIRVIVEDDGCGFDPRALHTPVRHLGLYGMQERAELLGGVLTIESRPGAGTSIFVEIPLNPFALENTPYPTLSKGLATRGERKNA